MSKAVKAFMLYIVLLLVCSLILSWFNINSDFHNIPGSLYPVRLIIIPTIIGGLIALKYTVSARPFKIFLIVYFSLWIIRYIVLFSADKIGSVYLFGKTFHLDLIIANYYKTASRLETPLPFVLFWFIYFFYTKIEKPTNGTEKEASEVSSNQKKINS
jgi:hypothetical protein